MNHSRFDVLRDTAHQIDALSLDHNDVWVPAFAGTTR